MTLTDLLPPDPDPDSLYDAFSKWTTDQGFELYPTQADALIEIVSGSNVVLSTPTGSGKSLVAAGAHFTALAQRRRSFYTAPIKALVSEKFFALCDMFGADNVGMLTGDASINPGAPIITATAEVLANLALRHGPNSDVGLVIMDEFHFYAEPDRGWAWQVPLLELPHVQFVLMSATLGDVTRFEAYLTRRTGRATATITSTERPVPLHFEYAVTPIHDTLERLLAEHKAPVYVVHFTQAAAIERALTSVNVCTRVEKDQIGELIGGFRFSAGFGKTLSRLPVTWRCLARSRATAAVACSRSPNTTVRVASSVARSRWNGSARKSLCWATPAATGGWASCNKRPAGPAASSARSRPTRHASEAGPNRPGSLGAPGAGSAGDSEDQVGDQPSVTARPQPPHRVTPAGAPS